MSILAGREFDCRLESGRPVQVTGFGLNAVDWICEVPVFPEHNTKLRLSGIHRLGGGQVATAMALCGRYGLKARYVGRVGDDEVGQFSRDSLESEPLDTTWVETVEGARNQVAVIIVDRPTGERTVLWDRDPALEFVPDDVQDAWFSDAQVLHLDGHDEDAAIEAARRARRQGVRTCLDIDKVQERTTELLPLIDFLLPSVDFAKRFSGSRDWEEALRQVARQTRGFTAITRGRHGCAAVWGDEVVEIAGFEVEAVDTTGAGDVFHGAFVFGLFQDWDVEQVLRFANGAGALSCTRVGARGGIPRLEEVRRLVGFS